MSVFTRGRRLLRFINYATPYQPHSYNSHTQSIELQLKFCEKLTILSLEFKIFRILLKFLDFFLVGHKKYLIFIYIYWIINSVSITSQMA